MILTYLSGPIWGEKDPAMWRRYADMLLQGGTLDPLRRDLDGTDASQAGAIVRADLQDIEVCDVVLVYWTGPSAGTAMEQFYAVGRGKPVYLVDVVSIGPWTRFHSSKLFATLEDACDAINALG